MERPRPTKRFQPAIEIVEPEALHDFHTVPPEASRPTHQATLAGLGSDPARLQLELERGRRAVAERRAEELRLRLAEQQALSRPLLSLPPSKSAWAKRGYQALGALIVLMGAGTAFLTLRNTAQEPRIDSTVARVGVQESTTDANEKRIKAIESYLGKLEKHSECVDAERDSAIQRGTGHIIEGDHDVEWKPQNKPAYKLRVLWETPTWSVETACPEKPSLPKGVVRPAAE